VRRGPAWLDLSPARGEIGDDGSIEVTSKLAPSVQRPTRETYSAQFGFDGPISPIALPVPLPVSLTSR
jgi:hypothetical protein